MPVPRTNDGASRSVKTSSGRGGRTARTTRRHGGAPSGRLRRRRVERERRDAASPGRCESTATGVPTRAASHSMPRRCERRREPLGRRARGREEAELRRAHVRRHRRQHDADDRGARRTRFERNAEAREERLHVARRRDERDGARVAAPIVELEREAELGAARPREADALDRAQDHAVEREQQRLDVVDRVLERHRLLDRAGERLRRERPLVLAARAADERGAGGAEPRRDLFDGQPPQVAERADAPARERLGDGGRRIEACERQRRQEAARRAGGDDLGAVAVVCREPRRDHARRDGRTCLEPDARRARDERRREPGLAADEMGRAGGVEVDGAVGRQLDAIGERRRDVDERAPGRLLGRPVARRMIRSPERARACAAV
jgi:hypothetical protein